MALTDALLFMVLVSSMVNGCLLFVMLNAPQQKKIPSKHKRYATAPTDPKPTPIKRHHARDYPERPMT